MAVTNPIATAKPLGYENDLSDFKPCIFDGYCGEPVGWGFEILKHLGEDRFHQLRRFGDLECISSSHVSRWCLVTKWLSRNEAAELFGAITDETFGPRGGWKSVTFGSKKFICMRMKSKRPSNIAS